MENNKRDSFIFYRSFYDCMQGLDSNQKAILFDAICEYSLNFKEPQLDGVVKSFFTLIKPNLQANNNKWANGKKGNGRPKTNKAVNVNNNDIDSIFNEISESQIWMEEKSMFLKSRNIENTQRLLKNWLLEQGTEKLKGRNLEDIKRHFVNSMKLKPIIEINPNLGHNVQGTF